VKNQFCFDISLDEKLKFYAPSAYIIEFTENITYVDKKATPLIIESFGIVLENLNKKIQELLSIIEILKPENLFNKFHKSSISKSKVKKTILDLLEDKTVGKIIRDFIDSKINIYLSIINDNNFPISLNLKSSKEFYKFRISTNNSIISAKLFFDKNDSTLNYSLKLTLDSLAFFPSEKNINIILDEPSWLVFDNKLFRLSDINSNKIKPFLIKKSIEIKTEMVAEYFQKFIKDIVKKVDIDAIGFDVIQKKDIISCRINIIEDFFKKKFNIELIFDYDGFCFSNHSIKNSHSSLINDLNGAIQVVKFKRNLEQESQYQSKLLNFGFELNENNFYSLKNENQDQFENIQFLINNIQDLRESGFLIENLYISNKKIQTEIATLKISSQENNDWFDVKMIIEFGNFEINFIEIIQNLKEKNRFFKLPNDNYFLIPHEWFTKYASIINFSKVKNQNLIVLKSNFTILEDLNLNSISTEINSQIEYKQSSLLKAKLRPYQIEGVKWLLKNHNFRLGACLADDMGLGKTLQTLALLVNIQENLISETLEVQQDLFSIVPQKLEFLKALIVAPSSLVFNWYNESRKFTPHFRRLQYIGNERKLLAKKLDKYDLIFTSYSVISRDINIFEKFNFRYLIIDESQQIKNKDSKVFKAISTIKTENKISLTGTPIENSLTDLWSQMQFINPDILGNFIFFTNYFKIPIEKNQDSDKISALKKLVYPFILRRTKDQVLKDLPELNEQIVYCDLSDEQEKLYDQEKSKARNELLKINFDKNRINILNVLMKLRQLSNHPKMFDKSLEIESGKFKEVTNYINSLLASGQKMLIFSSFVSHLKIYEDWCRANKIIFCKLIGETLIKDRENQIQQFQENNDIKIFFISLKSGGVGLNLTSASFVLLLDPWWNPFAEMQAIARAHRIGQLNKVNAVRFISKNTIEEKIILLQEKKKLLSESIIELENIPLDIDENLSFLLS
jgi:SNF2 family DNA or RNA helicase